MRYDICSQVPTPIRLDHGNHRNSSRKFGWCIWDVTGLEDGGSNRDCENAAFDATKITKFVVTRARFMGLTL